MRKLSFGRGRRKSLDVSNKAVKQVITGLAIPKSIGLIELEKNYGLLAEMVGTMIDRMHKMENEMEKVQKKLAEVMRSKRKSRF